MSVSTGALLCNILAYEAENKTVDEQQIWV